MAVPEDEGIVAIRWASVGDLEPMITTFGIRDEGLQGLDTVANILEVILNDDFPPHQAAAILEGWIYLGFELTYQTSTGTLLADRVVSVAGTFAEEGLTSNTAVLLQKRTALGGRRHRGRMFVPPVNVPASAIDNNGFIDTVTLGNFQVTYTDLLEVLETSSIPMVLHHSGTALDSQLVTTLAVANRVATQRRRMRP